MGRKQALTTTIAGQLSLSGDCRLRMAVCFFSGRGPENTDLRLLRFQWRQLLRG